MTGANSQQLRRAAQSNTRKAKTKPDQFTVDAAKKQFLLHRRDGLTVKSALEKIGRTDRTYYHWRNTDEKFRIEADQAAALQGRNLGEVSRRGERLSFAEFRKKYLNTDTFWHQEQWIDLLEGREPRELHEAQTYKPGKKSRILINVPPFHAKSQTITVDYVVYRLCMDPTFRVIIASAAQTLAQDFLLGIKQKLTHPDYLELQKAYAPDGGWMAGAEQWSQTRIVFGASDRDAAEKDPNVQVVGIGGQIYGRRCDMVIVDDAVVGTNVREWEKQMRWVRKEVASRIEVGGKLVVVGTRMAPVDLYSELLNQEHYGRGSSPWTHLASPAILEEGGTPEEHKTLWPLATQAWQEEGSDDPCDICDGDCWQPVGELEDGTPLFPRWDGIHLENGPRAENSNAEWALVYQQSSLDENMTFPEHAVQKAVNSIRHPGLLNDAAPGHRPGGMHGLRVIGAVDPAVKGYAGIVVGAIDPKTSQRYVLDAVNMKAPTPAELKQMMRDLTVKFGIDEWRVERTGLLQFFTQDEDLRAWFATRGVRFREHLTAGNNKWDPSYGVASCATLFGEYDRVTDAHGAPTGDFRVIREPLIELPRPSGGVGVLVHQLVTWTPELDPKRTPCDLVMAFWFFEVACREQARGAGVTPFRGSSRFSVRGNQKKRTVVNLADYRANTGS